MNLAVFLHSQKEDKDTTLPLPLAPLYILPHQKWYFSSPSLTPLRKRRQNTSLFKYLNDIQIPLNKEDNPNHNVYLPNTNQQILCVYEKCNYFDDRMKHIFDIIYQQFSHNQFTKQKIKCECNESPNSKNSQSFSTKTSTIIECLKTSKKNIKNQFQKIEQSHINWYQFSKKLIQKQLSFIPHTISQQNLYLYKIPQIKNNSQPIFNVLWNDNYLIFNNNSIQINQNMKSKAVLLCEQISKKLDDFILKKMKEYIPKISQELIDPNQFIQKLKNKVKTSTFRVWFYKKQMNNQIYILTLTHLTFKGVDCCLYPNFNIIPNKESKQDDLMIKDKNGIGEFVDITGFNGYLENRIKCFSGPSKSTKSLHKILKTNETQRIKSFIQDKLDTTLLKINQSKQQISQCTCCRNLMTSSQTSNQITANHIQQIRYLLQVKMGKLDNQPYDFVKICEKCYKIYLQHYKTKLIERRSEKKIVYNAQGSGMKNCHSFIQKNQYKDRNFGCKIENNSMKRLMIMKQLKGRAKSQLKDCKQDASIGQNTIGVKDRSISLKPPLIPKKTKKTQTTHTTNTENTIIHRQEFLEPNPIIRTQTEEQPLHKINSNYNGIRFKNQLSNKTHNLINRIISNSFETKPLQQPTQSSPKENPNPSVNARFIKNAIEEYEKIQRLSFKKLATKNYRNYMIKQASRQNFDKSNKNENSQASWKKSIKSYFQN